MKRTTGWNLRTALQLLLVSIALSSVAAPPPSTGGQGPGTLSQTRDMVIEGGEQTMRGETVEPPGNIIVRRGGTLILEDTRIVFNHTGYYEHGILLEGGSSMELRNSSIVAHGNMFYFRVNNSSLSMVDSELRRTHVICENGSRVWVSGSYLWALHCLNETVARVAHSQLCYLFLVDESAGDVDDCRMIEILLYDRSRVNVSDSTLRFIYYLDEGRANIENCEYEDEIRFKPMVCNLDVAVTDAEGEPVAGATVTLTRYGGEHAASAATDEGGSSHFTGLEEGIYTLTVTKEGYDEQEIERPLLDESQSETVQINSSTVDGPGNGGAAPLPVYMVAALAVTVLLYHLRGRLRGS